MSAPFDSKLSRAIDRAVVAFECSRGLRRWIARLWLRLLECRVPPAEVRARQVGAACAEFSTAELRGELAARAARGDAAK